MSSVSSLQVNFGRVQRRVTNSSSSLCCGVSTLHRTSNTLVNIKMLFTMRMLLAMTLCLCFAVPSPVLSFTSPKDKFAEIQITGVEEDPTEGDDINALARNILHFVGAEPNGVSDEETSMEDELTLTKRASGAKRPEREIRARPHAGYQLGRRNPVTTRSKFTFGKRSSAQISIPETQQLLEELQLNADSDSLRNKFALLRDVALYDNEQDNHEVQKDAYSAFSFGKRGMSAFSFGKRAMPSFSFGKRGMPSFSFGKRGMPSFSFGKRAMPSFAFGKRALGGSAFAFGRRDWAPTEQDFEGLQETGPYDKRADLAFAFGKRYDQ